jgi:hypothetical protein
MMTPLAVVKEESRWETRLRGGHGTVQILCPSVQAPALREILSFLLQLVKLISLVKLTKNRKRILLLRFRSLP